jgi:CRP/FNR family transcriptional regulator
MAQTALLDSTIKLLNRLPLFQEVPEQDLQTLAQHARLDFFERDAVIFYQGDVCDRIWLVRKGRVKIVHHDEDGREVILEFISPGEAFGGAVLFFPTHPATAKALEDASLASFPSEVYAQFLLNHPAVALKLLRMLGVRHLSMLNMQSLAGERVERRMAHTSVSRPGRATGTGRHLITIPSRQDRPYGLHHWRQPSAPSRVFVKMALS